MASMFANCEVSVKTYPPDRRTGGTFGMLTAPSGGHVSCPTGMRFHTRGQAIIGAADGPGHRLFIRGQRGPRKGRRGFPPPWARASVEVGGK